MMECSKSSHSHFHFYSYARGIVTKKMFHGLESFFFLFLSQHTRAMQRYVCRKQSAILFHRSSYLNRTREFQNKGNMRFLYEKSNKVTSHVRQFEGYLRAALSWLLNEKNKKSAQYPREHFTPHNSLVCLQPAFSIIEQSAAISRTENTYALHLYLLLFLMLLCNMFSLVKMYF